MVWQPVIVIIQKAHIIACCCFQTAIGGSRTTDIFGQLHQFKIHVGGQIPRDSADILATIIDHHYLQRAIVLPGD
jgi:hypothetical protein